MLIKLSRANAVGGVITLRKHLNKIKIEIHPDVRDALIYSSYDVVKTSLVLEPKLNSNHYKYIVKEKYESKSVERFYEFSDKIKILIEFLNEKLKNVNKTT